MRSGFVALLVLLAQALDSGARAEFISNAFGGEAENATRAAAAQAFEGYQSFYAAMSLLERRAGNDARPGFQRAVAQFAAGQKGYAAAATFLQGRPFVTARLDPQQRQLLFQFLAPFGANETSDQAAIIRAYAASFERTIALIQPDSSMSLNRFREIQTFIGRQILVGTLISQSMQPT